MFVDSAALLVGLVIQVGPELRAVAVASRGVKDAGA